MSEHIDQRRVPGLSRLFADYLYAPERVAAFYPGPPYDARRLHESARAISYPAERRRAMTDQLAAQNRAWGSATASATANLIDRFSQPDAVAVLTGQQVGYLGGPLLSLHKAMTAVKLAARLRGEGVNAVPIFWMASQDHDLAEVDHAWTLDGNANPVRVNAPLEASAAAAPTGTIRLAAPDAAAPDVPGLGQGLRQIAEVSGLAPALLADLQSCYRPGETLANGFARLLTRWFEESGLIVFDPLRAAAAAEEARAFYLVALERQAALSSALAERNRELEAAGYHVQVRQGEGATMLFLHRDGERLALRQLATDAGPHAPSSYFVGGERVELDEVKRAIERQPQDVSPAALLRPVIQDALFPTLASVTGPAETAYMAQSAVLYHGLGRQQPFVYPRASVTLVDVKAQRLLSKFGLSLPDLWHEPAAEALARRSLPPGIAGRMSGLRATFDGAFAEVKRELETLDPTLVDAAQGAAQKIIHQMEQLDTRIGRSVSRRSEELQRHARYLAGHLYPLNNLQERVLCAAAFAADGTAWREALYRGLELDCPDHQLIAI